MRLFHHMFSLMECSAPVLLARHFSILSATCYEVRMYEPSDEEKGTRLHAPSSKRRRAGAGSS